jgi:hypothetical protein
LSTFSTLVAKNSEAGDSPYGEDSASIINVPRRGETSMANLGKLGEEVKRYGYAKNKKIKLYGKELELISDPVDGNDENIFVDAREEGTDNVRQVQVPRNVVEMAKSGRRSKSE